MKPQAPQQELTTKAHEAEALHWLLSFFRRHGPGKYVVLLSHDGWLRVKRFPPPFEETCPQRLNSDART